MYFTDAAGTTAGGRVPSTRRDGPVALGGSEPRDRLEGTAGPIVSAYPELERLMEAPANPNKALWEKGDFTRIADSMRASGEALVRQLGITRGLRVLDLGCGDGTTAMPAARLGADVLGVDIARSLVEAGSGRAAEQGLAQ